MKHILLPAVCVGFLTPATLAIVDMNHNGVSDLWEKKFNSDELLPESFDPQADSDHDGWTNEEEAVAGTDPFDANPPDGLIRPDIIHTAQVTGAPDENGIPVVITPEAETVSWPTIIGKQYALQYSPDLTAGSWARIDDAFIGNGNIKEYTITLTQPDGSTPEKLFWRVAVDDADSDLDGLTNWEEQSLQTDPNNSDTDYDGVIDSEEVQNGTDPRIPRIWAFRKTTHSDETVTYTWKSHANLGDWFHIEAQNPDGTWKVVYSTTYGSSKLPHPEGSVSYSLTLDPATDFLP